MKSKPYWLVDFNGNQCLTDELPGVEVLNYDGACKVILKLGGTNSPLPYSFPSIANKTIINIDDTLMWLATGNAKYSQGTWWFEGNKLKKLFPKTIEKSYIKLKLEDYYFNESPQQWIIIDAIKK